MPGAGLEGASSIGFWPLSVLSPSGPAAVCPAVAGGPVEGGLFGAGTGKELSEVTSWQEGNTLH